MLTVYNHPPDAITALAFDGTGATLIVGTQGGRLVFVDRPSGRVFAEVGSVRQQKGQWGAYQKGAVTEASELEKRERLREIGRAKYKEGERDKAGWRDREKEREG